MPVEQEITLTAVCTDYCWTRAGPTVNYQWRLFVGGSTANDPYTEQPNLDDIATGKSTSSRCANLI